MEEKLGRQREVRLRRNQHVEMTQDHTRLKRNTFTQELLGVNGSIHLQRQQLKSGAVPPLSLFHLRRIA
jgi:hypothetical protein